MPTTSQEPRLINMHHLVGAQEIARLLGVSRQRVTQLTTDAKYDFPAPVVVLAMGKVWDREDVIAWAERTGRRVDEK